MTKPLKTVPLREMQGEDAEETVELESAARKAEDYLRSFSWAGRIAGQYFGAGVGGVVAVFLFDLEGASVVDSRLWVVVGDVPSAYFVTDRAKDPVEALDVYIQLMQEWISAVRSGRPGGAFPVDAAPTELNAAALDQRVELLQRDVRPYFEEVLKDRATADAG